MPKASSRQVCGAGKQQAPEVTRGATDPAEFKSAESLHPVVQHGIQASGHGQWSLPVSDCHEQQLVSTAPVVVKLTFKSIYIYVYIYTYIHVYTFICTHTYIYLYIQLCMHV